MASKLSICNKTVNINIRKIPETYRSIEYLNDKKLSVWSKICIGIITCDASKKRFDNFMNVFKEHFEKFNIMYFIIKADPTLNYGDSDYIVDGNNFWVNCEEAYEKLLLKVMVFYSYIEKDTNYDHVVKVDEGCLLDLSAIIKDLNLDYIGVILTPKINKYHWGKCKDPKLNTYLSDFKHGLDKVIGTNEFQKLQLNKVQYGSGGMSYRLSRKALTGISDYLSHVKTLEFAYEDMFIGQIMKIKKIPITKRILGRYHKIPNS